MLAAEDNVAGQAGARQVQFDEGLLTTYASQVQQAGISLSTDERIVVRLNPPADYVIGPKHSALVMT